MFKQNMSGGIVGIGVDIVAVNRFSDWIGSAQRLSKVFTQEEMVNYLHELGPLKDNLNTQQVRELRCAYWAARFAAKEAFFKALSNTLIHFDMTKKPFSLMFACQNVEVIKGTWDVPFLRVHWYAFEQKIGKKLPGLKAHLSLAHEREHAVANVIITFQELG